MTKINNWVIPRIGIVWRRFVRGLCGKRRIVSGSGPQPSMAEVQRSHIRFKSLGELIHHRKISGAGEGQPWMRE